MKSLVISVAAALALALSSSGTRAQAPKSALDRSIDALLAVREFKEVSISPDGARVAWVEELHARDGSPTRNSAIFLAELRSPSALPRRITAGPGAPHAEHGVAWSPDGRRLVFLSDAAKKDQLELYLIDAAGGAPRKLTHITGYLEAPSWSPDGKTLAVLFTENAPRAAGPLEAMTKDSGVVEQHIYEQRLSTVDLASGRLRQLSPADLYVHEYDWSPDGKTFLATAAHGAGDTNWYVAELYTFDASTGADRSIFKPPLQIAFPRWSPDGKSIAFIGGLMSDEGSVGGDVFLLPAAGGEARNLTPRLNASASWLSWMPSSDEILFAEVVDGSSGLATVSVSDSKLTSLWTGAEEISDGSWGVSATAARDGRTLAAIRSSFARTPEIWAGPANAMKQITRRNQNISPPWGEARNIHWTSDGAAVQGWLLFPSQFDPARRYPLVVHVHGGPGSAVVPSWPGPFSLSAALADQGYFVLMPNPRGSFGAGESFTRANVRDFGYGDFRDILVGVDEVLKNFPIDERRVGITGWSYGGYMTMWAVTQTDRFRAAVAGAGIANWLSYYGENDIDQWMIPFFGASVYDDPAVYARSSPINFIKNVKTPTLVLVGDSDGECPAPQSYEFWRALRTLGVETQFVIYPNEGHAFRKAADQRDVVRRGVEWFDRHLK